MTEPTNNTSGDDNTSGGGEQPDGIQNSTLSDPQEPVRVNHTGRTIVIVVVVAVIVALAVFFGVRFYNSAHSTAEKGSQANPVKIGVIGATDPQWVEFTKKAKAAGIYVKLVDFQDYTSENPALDSRDLDLNEFQHLLYLANYNVTNSKDLQPIGGTAIFPLGVYSSKVSSVKDIAKGQTVAIPNDETNQARAIGVLKAAGLVKLKGDWTAFTTPSDIDTSKSKVKVTALKAEQVANALKDPKVAAGVINNDYVADAGLKLTDSIYQDDAESKEARPYINVFVARKADADNPTYLKLVKIAQSKSVFTKLNAQSNGTAVSASGFTAKQLQTYLAQIEKQVRSQS